MRWEYEIFSVSVSYGEVDDERRLNRYGAQGWEIFAAQYVKSMHAWVYHAKRPVQAANLRIDLGQPQSKP